MSYPNERPLASPGYLAPIVSAAKCVGCGLCQTRCNAINVKEEKLLLTSAVVVHAGEGKEDRLWCGSYVELRVAEQRIRTEKQPGARDASDYFVPEMDVDRQ